MLRPMVPAAEFEKYGFKQCKGKRYENCYYLCVARGCVMFVGTKQIHGYIKKLIADIGTNGIG